MEKGLYCIEQLAETLDEDQIENLLPSLMSSMHRFMQMGNTDKCQVATLAVSALGVIIACAENVIGPHLNNCISMLQALLPKSAAATAEETPENIMLQASALDTLATLASAAGESFVPMAADSLSLAGQLVSAELTLTFDVPLLTYHALLCPFPTPHHSSSRLFRVSSNALWKP